jgi:hypothetical protein
MNLTQFDLRDFASVRTLLCQTDRRDSLGGAELRRRILAHAGGNAVDQHQVAREHVGWHSPLVEAGLRPPSIFVGDLKPRRDFSDVRVIVRAYWLLLEPELCCYMPNGRQQMTCW